MNLLFLRMVWSKYKTKGEKRRKKEKYDPIKVRDKAASFTLVPGVL